MSGIKAGMFSGLAKAQASRRASYEKPGHYIQMIERVKADKTRKDEYFLAIEKRIVIAVEGIHKTGEQVTHMMMKKHDSFLPNVKAFLADVLDINEESHNDEDFEQAMIDICEEEGDTANPLGQMFIEVENKDVMTKVNKPFTVINYKREVPAKEIAEYLADGDIDASIFYKKVINKDQFEALVAAEEAASAATG